MTIAHARIGDLVGEGLFFEHVSARMAFKLPALHDRGLVIGSGQRHTYPQSDSGGSVEYYSNERATQWNGYDGNPANLLFPASGERVLLDVVDNLRVLGPITVSRTGTGTHAILDGSDESATADAINDTLLPVGAATAFPAFDLFMTNFGAKPIDAAEAGAYPTIQLIDNADLGVSDLVKTFYPQTAAILPRTASRDHWGIWIKPAANLAADMGLSIWMDGLTGGK